MSREFIKALVGLSGIPDLDCAIFWSSGKYITIVRTKLNVSNTFWITKTQLYLFLSQNNYLFKIKLTLNKFSALLSVSNQNILLYHLGNQTSISLIRYSEM